MQVCISNFSFRDKATQSKILGYNSSAYEHCTDHQNYAYKVLAQTVETGLRYYQKNSNARRAEKVMLKSQLQPLFTLL